MWKHPAFSTDWSEKGSLEMFHIFYKVNSLQQPHDVYSVISILQMRKPTCPVTRFEQGKLPPKKDTIISH